MVVDYEARGVAVTAGEEDGFGLGFIDVKPPFAEPLEEEWDVIVHL